MSKLLKRALSLSILPASLMVTTKFLSVFLLIALKNLNFTIESTTASIFSMSILLPTHQDALAVNSMSNLISLLVIALPTLYFIAKKTILLDIRENPRTVVKLTKLNILKWIVSDKTTILQITIWNVFLWLIAGICIASSMNDETYRYISIIAGVISVISTWGLIKTYEIETDKIYPNNNHKYF